MFRTLSAICMVSMFCGFAQPLATPAFAGPSLEQLVENAAQYPIQPSEAASIARNANPDSKILNVKLLPNGVYAVTLKIGGSVSRVMVDATSGAIS